MDEKVKTESYVSSKNTNNFVSIQDWKSNQSPYFI